MSNWHIFQKNSRPHDGVENLPAPPSWRQFSDAGTQSKTKKKERGETYQANDQEIELVNAALYLRRQVNQERAKRRLPMQLPIS
jgi:hypothetical protein